MKRFRPFDTQLDTFLGLLKKKILKSSRDHKQKQDLVLCLEDLLADETEEPSESAEWLTALNRGGGGGVVMCKKHDF